MNSVQLMGNLGRINELKYAQDGRAVLNQSLAVRRDFKNKQGEYETDWVNIVAFGKTAELLANYTKKGDQIGVEGRIQPRSYENKQGQTVYVTEVVVNNITFTRNNETGINTNQQNNPNNYRRTQGNDYPKNGQFVNIDDSNLPF